MSYNREVRYTSGHTGLWNSFQNKIANFQVDANGYATLAESKMGESYGIIYHHPRDIPQAYGPTGPITTFSNGDYKYNRIYYRKK
ncbi:hypothetical protein [Sphingobacterium luzhongxinii]|uniref:hypothetical protein n=1 Tax=Sphingobacterium luzhongxinii TaxID=2654181 RepID=UPI0013DD4421|nr:hypothetical protein [Sphingobacterium sp. xlx-73]